MPLSRDPSRPVGLVLSGGGARGAFQVGVWEVLRTHPRGLGGDPEVVSGTSAGAINGALLAAGLPPRAMLEFWLGLADRPPVTANAALFRDLRAALVRLAVREPLRAPGRRLRELRLAAGLVRKHGVLAGGSLVASLVELLLTARFDAVSRLLEELRQTHVFDATPLEERLVAAIGARVIPRGRVVLALNAVDVRTGSVVRIVNAPPGKSAAASAHYRVVPDIPVGLVLASASIPLLFNPVPFEGRLLWDGGLLVNSPMAPAVALGARRIVPVLVTAHDARPSASLGSLGEAAERLVDTLLENAYNVDRKLLLTRNDLVGKVPGLPWTKVELFRAIRPDSSALFDAGSYLYFERAQLLAMYEAGKRAAEAWLARGPERDERPEADDALPPSR